MQWALATLYSAAITESCSEAKTSFPIYSHFCFVCASNYSKTRTETKHKFAKGKRGCIRGQRVGRGQFNIGGTTLKVDDTQEGNCCVDSQLILEAVAMLDVAVYPICNRIESKNTSRLRARAGYECVHVQTNGSQRPRKKCITSGNPRASVPCLSK